LAAKICVIGLRAVGTGHYHSIMCSTAAQRIAEIGRAIDHLAVQAVPAGDTDPIVARLAELWALLAELDPEVARRLAGYQALSGPDDLSRDPLRGKPVSAADDLDFERCAHFRMQSHSHLMRPDGLDRVTDLDLAPVEFRAARVLDGRGDVGGRHRPNSRPPLPALVCRRTRMLRSRSAVTLASSTLRISLAERARLIDSICFSAPLVQRIA